MKSFNNSRSAVNMAAFGLLAMFAAGALDALTNWGSLIDWNNAAETFRNLQESPMRFRLHVVTYMMMFIFDIVAAIGMYLLLKPVNMATSLLGSTFRIVYTAMIAATLVNHINVLPLIGNATYLSHYAPPHVHTMVMSALVTFDNGFSYSLIFFGVHILLTGYLAFRSGYLPKILAILLFAAAAGYLTDGFANLLFPAFRMQHRVVLEGFLGIAGVIGELVFALYLIIASKKVTAGHQKMAS